MGRVFAPVDGFGGECKSDSSGNKAVMGGLQKCGEGLSVVIPFCLICEYDQSNKINKLCKRRPFDFFIFRMLVVLFPMNIKMFM